MQVINYGGYGYVLNGISSCILCRVNNQKKGLLKIPEMIKGLKVVGINSNFFTSIKNVQELVLSRYISKINESEYVSCSSFKDSKLMCISVDANNEHYKSVDGVLFSKNGERLILYPPKKNAVKYEIPSSVKDIAYYAFSYNPFLIKVSIGKNVRKINNVTFYNCDVLEHVEICGKTTVLKDDAFTSCINLAKITFPNRSSQYLLCKGVVFSRGRGAGYGLLMFPPAMKLHEYIVPSNTEIISDAAFEFLRNVKRVIFPNTCKLPYYAKEFEINFYDPTQNGMPYISGRGEIIIDNEKEELIDNFETSIEELLDNFVVNDYMIIPSYEDYQKIETCIMHSINHENLNLLNSIKAICLPEIMVTVNPLIFKYFQNLEELKCNSVGRIQVENSVLFDGDTVVFYPQKRRLVNLRISRHVDNIGPYAFYHNQYLVNLLIDSPSITISRHAFTKVTKFENLITTGKIENMEAEAFSDVNTNLNIFSCDQISNCDLNAFSKMNGHVEIFVLTHEKRKQLLGLGLNGDCNVRIITLSQLKSWLNSIFEKYEITSSWMPNLEPDSENSSERNVEKLPRNANVEIKVMGHTFSCIKQHHNLVTKTVAVDMIDNSHNYRSVELDVGYCTTCKKYFVYSNVFRAVQDKIEYHGWTLVGARFFFPDGKSYGYMLEGFGELRHESILKISGYSVGLYSNLSHDTRMEILLGIIKHNWLTKQGVMSYLNWFIDFHGSNPSMGYAVQDWKQDLEALQNLKL